MCHLLMSYKVNDVTKRVQRDDNGNVTLIAHCYLTIMIGSCFPDNNKVQTMFTQGPNFVYTHLIPDLNNCDLRNNVNPSKKVLVG